MIKNKSGGHILAAITIFIWATTFVSTKVLLESFAPIEILVFRFITGLIVLALVYPKILKFQGVKNELLLAAAGLCGICLYYLLENISLTYTTASNVGIIVAAAPFFTAIFSKLFLDEKEKLSTNFIIGFILAMTGI
ncbi:MAG: DMT family transporter, partial [Eubacterium sp.]|nr:DMT family transporter [Eubacterium sp.]